MSIGLNECDLCNITNYKENKNKKQMTIGYEDKCYCKFHYKVVREYDREYKDMSEKDILKSLNNEGERLELKYDL